MKKWIAPAALVFCQTVCAQQSTIEYALGSVRVIDKDEAILLDARPPLSIKVLPGGHTWPRLALDEDGRIYVGATIVDSSDGHVLASDAGTDTTVALPYNVRVSAQLQNFRITRGRSTCTLSLHQLGAEMNKSAERALLYRSVQFAASENALIALVTRFRNDFRDNTYRALRIDHRLCKVARADLGNPDFLVEINQSRRGGWWITGSVEQTLLRSRDGLTWRKVGLPEDVFSLVSSYVVNDREIWLAAYLSGDIEDQLGLTYSSDGGKHWHSLRKGDPRLAQLPKGWLEGQKRTGTTKP
jgi:hypothetical protein